MLFKKIINFNTIRKRKSLLKQLSIIGNYIEIGNFYFKSTLFRNQFNSEDHKTEDAQTDITNHRVETSFVYSNDVYIVMYQ